jgi:hypothetical protein
MVALRTDRLISTLPRPPARRRHPTTHLRLVETHAFPLVRRDTLPDHADYRDTGCDLAPSCLRCPFVRCKYDNPNGARKLASAARDREIALLRRRHRAPIDMLAGTYGISRRTVFRVLKEQRSARSRK